MRRIDEKKLGQLRRYLQRGWRTVPDVVERTGLSRRTVYRWLGRLWHELIKRGSRDRTEYRITD